MPPKNEIPKHINVHAQFSSCLHIYAFQNKYKLCSFIEFAKGLKPIHNHYVAYKYLNNELIEYDDEHATLLTKIEDFYDTALAFYRCEGTTDPYTMNIVFPPNAPTNSRRTLQNNLRVTPGKIIYLIVTYTDCNYNIAMAT